MNKQKKGSLAVLISCFLALFVCLNINFSVLAKDFSLTVFHTNDSHGNVGHEAYLKTLAEQKKQNGENVLILAAGDLFHGQLIASLSSGTSIVKIMNEVGYDYVAPGNHDFNYDLSGLENLISMANFKVLAANIINRSDNSYTLTPYDIKEFDGVKIGIFGLATPETLEKTSGMKSLEVTEFKKPVETAQKIVDELKSKGCEIIIAVTHLGLDKSSLDENRSDNLAKMVDGIDLIIDGHSHTVLENGLKINNTLIAQTGEHGNNIGVVNLKLNDDGLSKNAYLINVEKNKNNNIIPDKNVLEVINQENKKIEALTSQKVTEIDFDLDGERSHVRKGETNFSDLLADALFYKTGSDLVIINGGVIRSTIKAGAITVGDVYKSFPFENIIVTQKVKGSEILKALEHGVSQYPEDFGATVQVAGINFKFDPNKEAGSRVFDVYFLKDNQPLDINKEYVLTTDDFILDGGDGYNMFVKNKTYKEIGPLQDLLIDYMTESDLSVYSKKENRIQIGSKPDSNLNLDNNFSYRVQRGDTLWNIALKFNTTWQKLAYINKINNPDLIYSGTLLKVS